MDSNVIFFIEGKCWRGILNWVMRFLTQLHFNILRKILQINRLYTGKYKRIRLTFRLLLEIYEIEFSSVLWTFQIVYLDKQYIGVPVVNSISSNSMPLRTQGSRKQLNN